MAIEIWVNIGSGNGLLPDGTKPLLEPMLTDHQWGPVTFILGQFQKRCLNHQSLKSIWNLHIYHFIQISQGPMSWYFTSQQGLKTGISLAGTWYDTKEYRTPILHYQCTPGYRMIIPILPLNSLAPGGIWLQSQINKFQTHFNDKYLKYFLWNCYQVNATIHHWSLIHTGSGNGLVPSGNKPLPEPVWTKIPVAIWRH